MANKTTEKDNIMSSFFTDAVDAGVSTKKSGIDKEMLMMMAMMGNGSNGMFGGSDSNPMQSIMMMKMFSGEGKLSGKLGKNPMFAKMLPTELEGCAMAFDGTVAVNGHAVKFDENGNVQVTTTEGLDMELPALAMPTKIEDIKQGDIIVIADEFVAVKRVNVSEKTIQGLSIERQEVTNRVVADSAFGGSNIKKVFNPFGATGEMNPMVAMMLMD